MGIKKTVFWKKANLHYTYIKAITFKTEKKITKVEQRDGLAELWHRSSLG